ncbi:hypothetical protein [Brevibacillus sp. VP]|nr:hypothetical protein [Brevibacillus sp. VP]
MWQKTVKLAVALCFAGMPLPLSGEAMPYDIEVGNSLSYIL